MKILILTLKENNILILKLKRGKKYREDKSKLWSVRSRESKREWDSYESNTQSGLRVGPACTFFMIGLFIINSLK